MMQLLNALLLVGILVASSAAGLYIRPVLSERHRNTETFDLIRLVTTMLVTFAAIVLGLLTTSVKGARDDVITDLRGYGSMIIELDQSMRDYGPEMDPVRARLRNYTAAAIASTWPHEPAPVGDYYDRDLPKTTDDGRIEAPALGNLLSGIGLTLRQMDPKNAIDRRLLDASLDRLDRLEQRRWKLIAEARSSIAIPFYVVLVFWMAVVFASFGLCAPRNPLVWTMLWLGAVSIASAIFVINVMDLPFGGLFPVTSGPLRSALAHLLQ
jgi:hypothetical protein